MMLTRKVSGLMAFSTSSGLKTPEGPGLSLVTSKPWLSRKSAVSSIALCSSAFTMMCFFFPWFASAVPLRARLSLSEAPEVKIISRESALMSEAILFRASSTASAAFQP